VLDFLEKAQKDPKLSARVYKAVERGGKTTAQEVLEIASEFGFSFTLSEFQKEARRDIENRFAAGDQTLEAAVKPKSRKRPPESACARGCLSWTVNYCPRD